MIILFLLYLLAVVEDDSAVWPTVMIHQTQIWENTNSHSLKTPLITHSEAIAVNLEEREISVTTELWTFKGKLEGNIRKMEQH